MTRFILSLTFAFTPFAWALSDADPAGYALAIEKTVIPWAESTGRQNLFIGKAGIPIAYRMFKNPAGKGSVTVVQGAGENMWKYFEVAYDLYHAGYSVFMLDHRGQGSSGRMLFDVSRHHVDRFENYVDDLKFFHDNVVRFQAEGPKFLLGHSMGGCISTYYAELYPEDFKAIALMAPMHQVRLDMAEPLALIGLAFRVHSGGGANYASSPSDPLEDSFGEKSLTHSQPRWRMAQDIVEREPAARLFGPTNNWVREAVSTSIAVRTRDWALNARVPILLFQAGEDALIAPEGQKEFCANAPDCRLEFISGARHEILMETDSIRAPALRKVLAFFGANAGR